MPQDDAPAPALSGVLETALYVDNMDRARAFYESVLGLQPMFTDARLTAYPVGGRSALLLFRRGAATETAHLPGGTIPPHDGAGPIHCAFAIAASALPVGKGTSPRAASPSKVARSGGHPRPLAASASTSATPTATCWNSPRPAYGRA